MANNRKCTGITGHAMRLNNYAQRSTDNPLTTLKEKIDDAQFPSGSEPAIIHPMNNAVVKIRDNACIDIFSDTNTGIRIDPNVRNISFITDGERHHLGYLKAWIQKDVERYVGRNSSTKINGNILVEVQGNADIKIGQNVNITNDGDVRWTSGGNMYFSAPNYHFD